MYLEKNNQYGGNLQTFVRDKTIFDTGIHYIGGLSEGQNLYKYFKYLGIMDQIELKNWTKMVLILSLLKMIKTNILMLKVMIIL